MDRKLIKLKRKLYRQLAKGRASKATATRQKLLAEECQLRDHGFHFGAQHIVK